MKLALNIARLACCVLLGFGFSMAINQNDDPFKFLMGCAFFFTGLIGYIDTRIAQSK